MWTIGRKTDSRVSTKKEAVTKQLQQEKTRGGDDNILEITSSVNE